MIRREPARRMGLLSPLGRPGLLEEGGARAAGLSRVAALVLVGRRRRVRGLGRWSRWRRCRRGGTLQRWGRWRWSGTLLRRG